ncbi:MAG: bifunctional folylpolyglutamate synthase/dihydrofolate synthase [Proteobacteria bacterium]|nr:bifunctional folylpolyglutamate synthase/dihydrofolate synthase [Pseudomonadota bacterium]
MKISNNKTLEQWLTYLENQHSKEIQLGLDRILEVAKRLALLSWQDTKIITVAGTNGKGSTVAFLEAAFVLQGYQVGAYTSPHLLHFNERIRVNRSSIDDESLCQAFLQIEEARKDIHLTYFETATLAALLYFKAKKLDLIILEVGLGGRLDATNIIDADLAIITTIDLDHQDYLGNTIDAIAFEKAGIIKQGKPIIYADLNPSISIINQAKLKLAPLYFLGKDYSYEFSSNQLKLIHQDKNLIFSSPSLHPNAIAAGVIASYLFKDVLPIENSTLIEAGEKTKISGRLELINYQSKSLLLDVSHNPQAAKRLAQFIASMALNSTVHIVFSALKDKDLKGLIEPLLKKGHLWYIAPLENKRASSINEIKDAFQGFSGIPYCFDDIDLALDKALEKAKAHDLIVVYGSFYTVARAKVKLGDKYEISDR